MPAPSVETAATAAAPAAAQQLEQEQQKEKEADQAVGDMQEQRGVQGRAQEEQAGAHLARTRRHSCVK